ncbi:MAG: type I polyketide synthase, partial [Methylovulum sp.]|nr:type I polyketide synthase [Methylovulum sp.]
MDNRVALIAYSVRLPGTDTQRFWGDLLAQKDLVTHVDTSRWSQDSFLHPDKRHPGTSYSFAAGSIGDISGFDAPFFGISPREAILIDPQQRVLLELAWETLENAGIPPATLRGSDCGVYVGISNVDYAYRIFDDLAAIEAAAATGMISSIASNRISYVFDLHGPSISMDTACSSSLVAFHQACQAIRSGEISQALAGGINLHLHPYAFISFSKATMLSKTGRCHVFAESGDGYVRSEGGGLFFLKNYDQALADGDPILALIAGSAVNTDGHKSGLTIPNPYAQAALMSGVYEQAGIDPNHIDYFEAHGTGTAVGDPIETHAIGLALGQKRRKPLLIGSVKSNLGHLESASGVAGLAKALNCLKYRAIPATIGATHLNPNIKFADWNLKVITDTRPLKAQGGLTIGVNSFGFGGANAHVILQTPPGQRAKKARKQPAPTFAIPLVLSAKDQPALQQAAQELADFISANPQLAYYDLAYSAFFHRERHSQGLVVFADNLSQAAVQLEQFAMQTTLPDKTQPTTVHAYTGQHLPQAQGLAFVYSGNGCQWQGMGKQLLEQSATFRSAVMQVDTLFQTYANFSLVDELAGRNGEGRYQHTEIAQPALFALQVGVTEVLREQGFQATAVMGHSVGEVAAAWACGALSLPEAVKVIFYRSHHQGKTQGSGGMSAAGINADDLGKLLATSGLDKVYLAGINSHRGVTLAGDVGQLAQVESLLAANQTFFKRLDLAYAFHSPAMDPIEAGVREDLAGLAVNTPTVPFYSSVTGSLLDTPLDGAYWWHNIREPVHFAHAVKALLATGCNTLVEIGAHPVLQAYLNDGLKNGGHTGVVIPTITRNNDSNAQLLNSIAQLMLAGADFDHKRWFPTSGLRVNLPNYPWQREKLWHPITSESQGLLYRSKQHPLLGYALKQHALIWENQLDTQLQAFLADHNVGGAVVFPGAGFAELAVAAAYLAHAGEFVDIEELEIRTPLILSHDHSKVIRFTLDTGDGRFTLQSRELSKAPEWLQHSLGRTLSEATGSQLAVTAPPVPKRAPDFDRASHAQLTDKAGLDYGPAFQAIQHGWLDGNSALGVFLPPTAIAGELGHYYLHPALLDCAFQLVFQILKDELHRHDDIAFVPVKIGRLHVRTTKAVPVLAKATLLHQGPHSLKAEFTLFDNQGQAVAVVKDVRFRAIRLHKAQAQALQYLDYHITAAPLPMAAQPLPMAWDITGMGEMPTHAEAVRRYSSEVEPLLDSLCQQFFAEALGEFADAQRVLSTAWFNGHCRLYPKAAALLRTLLEVATEQRLLVLTEAADWRINCDTVQLDIPATAIWNTLVQEYPDYFYLTQLVGRVGRQLPRLLRGEVQAEELGIQASLYAAITSHIFARTGKKTVADALSQEYARLIGNLPAGQRLNVLEISAHSPPFAPLLCPQWDFNQADYVIASLDDPAYQASNGLREHFPLLRSFRWQATAEANRQALAKPANLAIVHLNVANTQDIQQVLGQLSGLLLPGSPVYIIGQQPARWIDAALGMAADWWLGDTEAKPLSPQVSVTMVSKQLQSLGFEGLKSFEFMPDCYSGTYLLAATSAATGVTQAPTPKQSWLLLADTIGPEQTLAQQLAKRLQKHNQYVIIAPSHPETMAELA